eukprot:scaffold424746_cov20-Prasinocladus_malaysianus.AAC.1
MSGRRPQPQPHRCRCSGAGPQIRHRHISVGGQEGNLAEQKRSLVLKQAADCDLAHLAMDRMTR